MSLSFLYTPSPPHFTTPVVFAGRAAGLGEGGGIKRQGEEGQEEVHRLDG